MKLEARLRAFAAFARQRSFSAAAAELRISQPAISKHIAELEHALGLKLVDRARRDGALTSAGDFVANCVLRAEAKQTSGPPNSGRAALVRWQSRHHRSRGHICCRRSSQSFNTLIQECALLCRSERPCRRSNYFDRIAPSSVS